MCSAELAPTHQHLLEPLNRKLICVIALYPIPAGATESLFSLDSWGDIVSGNPVLEEMEADVEALFVNRIGYFRCPAWPIARRLLSLPSTTFQEARRRF
jgi:hypothetical protein